ncbi:MAG: hypothetical protein ACREJB_16265, partial [Planctomycetaceae bacterium]
MSDRTAARPGSDAPRSDRLSDTTPLLPAFAPDPGPPPLPPLPPVDPDAEIRALIADLARQRDAERASLRRQQAELRSAQNKSQQLENQLGSANSALDQIARQARLQEQKRQSLTEKIAEAQANLEEAQRRHRQLQDRNSNRPSRFAFVPYDGETGTTRRPMLIEFTAEGVRFLPENVTLSLSDLAGFNRQYNPLRAGVQALSDYWRARHRVNDLPEEQLDPYVLFIVRPSGIPFYPATQFVTAPGQRWGYELLEENAPLALPEPDPQAVGVLKDAIAQTLAHRDQLRAALVATESINNRGMRFRAGGMGPGEDHGGGFPFGELDGTGPLAPRVDGSTHAHSTSERVSRDSRDGLPFRGSVE